MESKSSMMKVGGLWVHKDKNGDTYLTGKLSESTKVMIMKHKFKKPGDNQPEYMMYFCPLEKQESKAESSSDFL